jgi:PKD repeat protein
MPTHRYTQAGTYTVTLTVANGLGQTATTSRTVTVTNTSSNVTASFTFSPTAPAVNQFVYFDASASRPTTASFAWNFGDGSPPDSGVNPTHRFAVAGTFTVTLTVSNAEGQMATATRTVTVTNTSSSVTASFSFSPTAPTAGQTVFFNASASRPTTGKFEWDFGDGTAGTGMLPSRVYAQPGTYTVTLRVSDDAGQSATTTRIVTVSPTTLTADFTFSPTDPTISRGTNTVRFDATPSSAGVTTWTWDYGDGAAVETGQQVSHTFTRVGTWVVRLTVGDGTGRTATVTKNVTVSP